MQIVNVSVKQLNYSLCPTLYSVRLKSTSSPYKMVVHLQSQSSYIDITTWQDIRVQQPILSFKVVLFNDPAQTTFHTVSIKPMNTKVVISDESSFTIETVQINKIKQSQVTQLYKLTLLPSDGYQKFKTFRKKVKKLQNITSSLDWKISCRLRIVQNSKITYLEIDDQAPIIIDFNQGPIKVQLEQLSWLSSPQDYMASVISDNIVCVTQSSQIIFSFSQYLTLKFKLEKIASSQTISKGLLSLRILESSNSNPLKVCVKNPQPHLQVISPVVVEQQVYFDIQYYYLCKNLQDTLSNSSKQSVSVSQFKVFQQLRQLTPAFPDFPHLKNQIVVPINNMSMLQFERQNQTYKFKVFQLMSGLNSIRLGKSFVRFYVQFQKQQQTQTTNNLRMFKIHISDIWNLPIVRPLKIKILNNTNIYSVDLTTSQKELKNMLYQNQFSKSHQLTVKEGRKTIVITKSDKYIFTEIPQKQFYISQSYADEQVYFSILTSDQILYSGSIKFSSFASSQQLIIPLQNMSSKQSFAYSYIKIQYSEISRHCNSLKSLYKLAYRMDSKHNTSYQLIVKSVSQNKLYKKKINTTTRFVDTELALISPTQQYQMQITVRRHSFDEISNEFMYVQLLNKIISLNCNTNSLPENLIRIQSQQYQVLSYQLDDVQIGKINFSLQITHMKQEFIDRENYLYSFRIPKQFWQILKQSFKNINSITFQILSSKKQKKSSQYPRTKEVTYMDSSEFNLLQSDYRDSIAIIINDTEMGYSKFYNLLNAKIQFPQKQIVFDEEGEWNLGVLNIKDNMVPFIFTFKQCHDSDKQSVRTVSKSKGKSKKGKSIDLNKTIKFQDTIMLKQQINSIVQQNRMLITKAVRLQSNNTVLHQKIKQLEDISKRGKVDIKYTDTHKKRNPNQAKMSAKYRSVCGCGATQSLYIGYCQQCINQLQKTYKIVYQLFQQRATQYQQIYFQKVLKKQKIQKLQGKVKKLKQKLMMKQTIQRQQNDNIDQSSYIETIDRISSLKNEIFTLSLKTKNTIECSSTLQQTLQTKINQSTKNIFKMMQDIQSYKTRMKQLNGLIELSK